MMDKPIKVEAFLRVVAEYYDPEATPETVRYCVEQTLEDAGYDVDVIPLGDEDTACRYMAMNYLPSNADREKLLEMNSDDVREYLFQCWKGIIRDKGKLEKKQKETGWIPVSDRLPPEHDTIFAKLKGTDKWRDAMFEKSSDDVRVVWRFEDGTRGVGHSHTMDGVWECEKPNRYPKRTVTHWMENPKLPEEDK